MTDKTQPTAHAEITAPISADLRGIEQKARELPEPSPTAGMNLGQRILHVGGRENKGGYIEFGSVAAVRALVGQVLRDLQPAQPVRECLQQSAEAQAWLVHLPSSDTQNVYDSRDDAGYIDDLTNNDDAVVTPLYAALQAAPPAERCQGCGYLVTQSEHKSCIRAAARAQEHATQLAGQVQAVQLQHVAVSEGGKLRWMTGRKFNDCELYCLPDGSAIRGALCVVPTPAHKDEQA